MAPALKAAALALLLLPAAAPRPVLAAEPASSPPLSSRTFTNAVFVGATVIITASLLHAPFGVVVAAGVAAGFVYTLVQDRKAAKAAKENR